MAEILRGDIYWADLNPVRGKEQAGSRPVLVLSHELFNRKSGTVIAMGITSQAPSAGYPLTLPIASTGMPRASWIKISQVRTISVERLGRKICRIDEAEIDQAIEGLLELVS